MSSKEETLQKLQVELSDKLEALKTQGLDEAEQQERTAALLLEFGARLQAATAAAIKFKQFFIFIGRPYDNHLCGAGREVFVEEHKERRPPTFWRKTQG